MQEKLSLYKRRKIEVFIKNDSDVNPYKTLITEHAHKNVLFNSLSQHVRVLSNLAFMNLYVVELIGFDKYFEVK